MCLFVRSFVCLFICHAHFLLPRTFHFTEVHFTFHIFGCHGVTLFRTLISTFGAFCFATCKILYPTGRAIKHASYLLAFVRALSRPRKSVVQILVEAIFFVQTLSPFGTFCFANSLPYSEEDTLSGLRTRIVFQSVCKSGTENEMYMCNN